MDHIYFLVMLMLRNHQFSVFSKNKKLYLYLETIFVMYDTNNIIVTRANNEFVKP